MDNSSQNIFNQATPPNNNNAAPTDQPSVSAAQVETQKIDQLVDQGNNTLFRLKTHQPLDIFPNEVVIDINKVTIIFHEFFKSKHFHSVMIKDISDVVVNTSFFFAQLEIVDAGFKENSITMDYLKRDEAKKARLIIQGLVVANDKGIDVTKIPTHELLPKLEELGSARITI